MSLASRYVICPGTVRSRADGDIHYIDAHALAFLYGLPWHECLVMPVGQGPLEIRRRAQLQDRIYSGELIALRPRYDGNYTLPTGPKP